MPNTNINDLPESNFYVPVFVPNVGFSKKELSSFVNNGNLGELIVPLYNEQSTAQTKYNKGDYCIHDRKLYKCVSENGTYGPWDDESEDWNQVPITTLIQDYINKNLEDYVNNIDLGNLIIDLYDESKENYAVGDCVIYNKELYRCKVENTRELPTVGTDWEPITLIKLINNRFNELGTVLSYEGNKTVAQLNALTTRSKKPGRVYSVTDTGTLTEGTFDNNGFDGNLRLGDEVALNSSKLWTYLGNVTETDQFITEDELSDVTAPKWNESDTYTLGKSVLYERKVYVCKVDSATVGTWVSSEWRQIKVGESFGQNTDSDYTYPGLVPMVSGTNKVLTPEGWVDISIASKNDVEYIIDEEKYNPLNLPHNTVRVRTSDGLPPEKYGNNTSYDVATKVAGSDDLYDVYKESNDFTSLLFGSQNVVEVLGANTRTIIRADNMFEYCSNLESVALFDTSKVSNMNSMFSDCSKLVEVPLFNTSITASMSSMFHGCSQLKHVPLFDAPVCSSVYNMFSGCVNVESGALDLYNHLKDNYRLANADKHVFAFENCGRDTVTGAAELAQIPDDWKGVTSV